MVEVGQSLVAARHFMHPQRAGEQKKTKIQREPTGQVQIQENSNEN